MKKFDILITDHIAEEGIEILEKAESVNYEIRAGNHNIFFITGISLSAKISAAKDRKVYFDFIIIPAV